MSVVVDTGTVTGSVGIDAVAEIVDAVSVNDDSYCSSDAGDSGEWVADATW